MRLSKKSKQEVKEILKNIRYEVCTLERDYGIEWEGYMGRIICFITECIADKYSIDLKLRKD